MHSLMRRAWVDIDLGALLRNGTTIATQSRAPLLPMVKADGYGLGAVRVARTLELLDPWGFGVATVAEGEELRGAAIKRPIIIFTPLLTGGSIAVPASSATTASATCWFSATNTVIGLSSAIARLRGAYDGLGPRPGFFRRACDDRPGR